MVTIKWFSNADALAVAGLIKRCLREVNSRGYSSELIERMHDHFVAGSDPGPSRNGRCSSPALVTDGDWAAVAGLRS
jgi:hypothetical protein